MLGCARLRLKFGNLAIADLKAAKLAAPFRGLPELVNGKCPENCSQCLKTCPTGAVSFAPLMIDLGRCIFCGDCARECPEKAISFSSFHKTGTNSREFLKVGQITADDYLKNSIVPDESVRKIFGKSLKLRQVSAAGCNSCEMELNACGNVNFDLGRFGIEFVASPRHADGIVITGPVSKNMAPALLDTYRSIPDPKIVIATGACAISGGVFAGSPALDRSFFEQVKVDLFIPGCPIHPLTFINALLDYLKI
ncbi:MAG: 4Fe-4S binding protein [Candidatus Wallbacteria bacterium]|nr:4Fe-4S binding protein [Candidatus Wallbacteria bacterium]